MDRVCCCFKQKTAYEMRISDWSSDVCSSDLLEPDAAKRLRQAELRLDISRKVAASESLDEVLETLIAITTLEVGAERGTLFLNDSDTGELYSRIALCNFKREIRLLTTTGIAGHVYTAGKGLINPPTHAAQR